MARILILEDQVELGSAWRSALVAGGHHVELVSTYEDFERVFQEQRIDLMVIDLSIAGDAGDHHYGGLVALSDNLLRGTIRGQKIPSIVVSGHLSQSKEAEKLRSRLEPFSPDRVMAKPFSIATLKEAIDELLV